MTYSFDASFGFVHVKDKIVVILLFGPDQTSDWGHEIINDDFTNELFNEIGPKLLLNPFPLLARWQTPNPPPHAKTIPLLHVIFPNVIRTAQIG